MIEKNDELQDKLSIIDTDTVKVVIPSYILEEAINSAIMKVNNQLINSLDEASDTLAELGKVEMIEKLDNVELINKMTKRVEELEYQVEEMPDNYWVEDEISSQTSEFVNEYDIEDKINNIVDDRGFADDDEFRRVELILGQEINALKEQLNRPNIFKRMVKAVKKLFSYNFKYKVRARFSNNK